ncbi:Ig delta chain C region membrane-bound form [Apodemus speciosus]|uniref:Ig delta chain C region membrane-bound form n=1 Tax=Apodemus speciosus TaxID=105296 RepID=A0ABQ0FF38_APOSI
MFLLSECKAPNKNASVDLELSLPHKCIIKNAHGRKEKTFKLPERWNSQSSQKTTPTLQANDHSTEATKATAVERGIVDEATAPSNLTVNILTTSTHPEMSSWLLCEVSGFYPEKIHLTWLSIHSKKNLTNFVTAQPTLQSGVKFQAWSVLRLPATLSPSVDTYTCVVEHEASKTKLNASKSLEITGIVNTNTIPYSCIKDEQSDSYMDLEEENGLWPTLCTFVALFLLTLLYSGFVTFIKVK